MGNNRLTIGCLGFTLLVLPANTLWAQSADTPDSSEKPAPPSQEPKPEEAINVTAFEKEAQRLWRCRYDVAAKLRKAPAEVLAGNVLIRFTVNVQGVPFGVVVVAEQATDSDVLTCVKTAVERWRMSPPPQSDLYVEKRVALGTPIPDSGR